MVAVKKLSNMLVDKQMRKEAVKNYSSMLVDTQIRGVPVENLSNNYMSGYADKQ